MQVFSDDSGILVLGPTISKGIMVM